MRLIDANKIIFHEIDEIGGEYFPHLGCSKDQIYSLPPVEAIPKAEYEARVKADMVAMLTDLKNELIDISWNIDMYDSDLDFECCYLSDIDKVIRQKIDKLKGEEE